jgi:putative hydrolase of the HAD superfamily
VLAILFDLDNTLIDRDAAFQVCLAEAFADPSQRQSLGVLDAGGVGCRQALFAAWAEASGEMMNQAILSERLAAQLSPNPRLLAWLARLRESYKLGVISNGGEGQRRKLEAAGLAHIFAPEHVWVSSEVGLEKPDPRIFWLACQILEVEPSQCLYVGDMDEVDGAGAKAAGMAYLQISEFLHRAGWAVDFGLEGWPSGLIPAAGERELSDSECGYRGRRSTFGLPAGATTRRPMASATEGADGWTTIQVPPL